MTTDNHDTPLDVLESSANKPPAAILRVALCRLTGADEALGDETYVEALRNLFEAGWWIDEPDDTADADEEIEGYPYCPQAILTRCEAHHEWDQFIEQWGHQDNLSTAIDPNADTVYFCALYMFAHKRGLL